MNIILIGMPSAGKSTIGRFLAQKLGMQYIDTDSMILESTGKPLREIVDQDGLEKFLEIQGAILSRIVEDNAVISTGGSCIYCESAMEYLKEKGIVFFLKVPFEELEGRINPDRRFARNISQSFGDLYRERLPLYEKLSDEALDCSGKSIEKIASEIEQIMLKYNKA